MIYNEILEIGSLSRPREIIWEIKPSDNYVIVRTARQLYFYDRKDLNEVTQIEIPIDNTFGSKQLLTINDHCFTPVFPKVDPKSPSPSEGSPDYAELQAFTREGLVWKYCLEGWTMAYDTGGIFVVGHDLLVVSIKKNDKKSLVFLDAFSGLERHRVNGLDTHKTGGNVLSPMINFSMNDRIGIKEFEKKTFSIVHLANDETVVTELPVSLVQTVALSTDYFFVYHIEELLYSRLSQFRYSDLERVQEFFLDFKFRAYKMIASGSGRFIVFLNKDNYSLHCFNTESKSIVWVWKSDFDGYPSHFVFDSWDNIIVLDGDSRFNQHIIVIDVNTGEVIQNLQEALGNTPNGYPFVIDDKILVVKRGKLIALSRAEQA